MPKEPLARWSSQKGEWEEGGRVDRRLEQRVEQRHLLLTYPPPLTTCQGWKTVSLNFSN